jgi:hypothetical protein
LLFVSLTQFGCTLPPVPQFTVPGRSSKKGYLFMAISATNAFTFSLAVLLLAATHTSAQTVLIDTGQGGSSSIGATSLFSTGTACSPQPTCASAFQLVAAQFTLTQAATLDSVQIWMGPFGSAGSLAVRIRSDNHGLPGDTQPPYLGPVSIYEKTYPLGNIFTAGWVNFPNYNAILAAGTYWLSLEPVSGSGLSYNMPGGAAHPLAKYAFFGNGNPGYLALSPNPGLGVRVLGTNFPGYAFGTATRTLLTVDPFLDTISGGEGKALDYHWIIDLNGAGSSFGVARLNENGTPNDLNGLSAGAYAVTCWSIYASCSTAGGRGVAYRTFLNSAGVPKTFRVNATLEGAFFGDGGARATAGIYAFNSSGFANTLAMSGKDVAHYLLDRDALAELGAANSNLSLATLFPGSVLTTAFVAPLFPTGQVQTSSLKTGLITLQPGETFTLMFDVTAYSSNGGSSNFADTLAPDTNFFTDSADQPVTEIIAVGPSAVPSAQPTSLVLTPASASNAIGTTHTLTATATDATGAPVPNATVTFRILSGPNAGQPGPVITDANGVATFSYSSAAAGTDSIQASIKSLQSNTAQAVWTAPGSLDHIAITPAIATITAGANQTFTVTGFDKFNNSRGDLTGTTTFAISPDGSCTGNICTVGIAGSHTVTATNSSFTAQASLLVNPAKTTPALIWPTPAPISAGTPLSTTQLNATANVPGTFVYTPPLGTVLAAGTQTLSVSFTPADTANYNNASAQVTLTVTAGGKTTPTIIWATPSPVTYGTPLSKSQLNATSNVAGTFAYSPKAGAILPAGAQVLQVTFTPSNTTLYNGATASVTLQVNPAKPSVLWLPVPLIYGNPLGPLQLDAVSLVPGKYTYTPGAGAVLAAGKQKLTAIFVPDSGNFQTISVEATLLVLKACPLISWKMPPNITVGTALGSLQLNATANVPGNFVFSPPAGTKLGVGVWRLTTVFTPNDTANYQTVSAQTMITVKAR